MQLQFQRSRNSPYTLDDDYALQLHDEGGWESEANRPYKPGRCCPWWPGHLDLCLAMNRPSAIRRAYYDWSSESSRVEWLESTKKRIGLYIVSRSIDGQQTVQRVVPNCCWSIGRTTLTTFIRDTAAKIEYYGIRYGMKRNVKRGIDFPFACATSVRQTARLTGLRRAVGADGFSAVARVTLRMGSANNAAKDMEWILGQSPWQFRLKNTTRNCGTVASSQLPIDNKRPSPRIVIEVDRATRHATTHENVASCWVMNIYT